MFVAITYNVCIFTQSNYKYYKCSEQLIINKDKK